MKQNEMNELLATLNNSTFKNAPYKLKFEKIGKKYCIIIHTENKYLFTVKFNTYDDILSHLNFLIYIFTKDNNKCGK